MSPSASSFRMPRIDEPPPNLALMVIGKALAQSLQAESDRPLPPALADIVRRIEEQELRGTARHDAFGGAPR